MSPAEELSPPGSQSSRSPLPPRFRSYLALNLAVWVFLAILAWILSEWLGSSHTIILLSVLLAIGFFAVSVFDYLWLRFGRRD